MALAGRAMAGAGARGAIGVALALSVLLTLVMAREFGGVGCGRWEVGVRGGMKSPMSAAEAGKCNVVRVQMHLPPFLSSNRNTRSHTSQTPLTAVVHSHKLSPRIFPPQPLPPGRYQESRKMMPAGMTAAVSLLMSAAYIGALT